MKILYAVQATGNGHIGRARVMAEALKKQNIEVDWIFSGRPASTFFDMQSFDNFKAFSGLSFIVKNNKISIFKTLVNANLIQFYKDVKSIDFAGYDLFINDFEPITAWAAKLQKVKSIGLSHQSAFLYDIPFVKRNFLFDLSMKHYAPIDLPIGIHWQRFNDHIIPPIIAKNSNKIECNKSEIVVYIPFHSAEETINLLKEFTEYNFHIFRHDKPKHNYPHLTFYNFSRTVFAAQTAKCSGIITNAGFELPSEALQSGKKLLVEPLKNQMEQISNAHMLDQFEWSRSEDKISKQHIKQWLDSNQYKKIVWPNVADAMAEWIKTGNTDDLPQLSHKLWKQVNP